MRRVQSPWIKMMDRDQQNWINLVRLRLKQIREFPKEKNQGLPKHRTDLHILNLDWQKLLMHLPIQCLDLPTLHQDQLISNWDHLRQTKRRLSVNKTAQPLDQSPLASQGQC